MGKRYRQFSSMRIAGCVALAALVVLAPVADAELAPEPMPANTSLGTPTPHWTFYHDLNVAAWSRSRFVLMDADTAEFLGQLSVGLLPSMHFSRGGQEIVIAETYYTRGNRGKREDVVAFYNLTDLSLTHEITLPHAKRGILATAATSRSAVTRNGRFLVIYNFTPAQSVDVIDLSSRAYVGEIPTPGCSLVYATGEQGVSMICGDGSLLTLLLDDTGQLATQSRSEKFFDPDADPVQEDAATINGTTYFASYGGDVYPVDFSGDEPKPGKPWALVDHDEPPAGWFQTLLTYGKAGPWLPGGAQFVAAHEKRGELYVLTHPLTWSETANEADHDFPGLEVWVYDVAKRERIRRIELEDALGNSLHVTTDDKPLLVVAGYDLDSVDKGPSQETRLQVYDAVTGEYLRDMPEHGGVPMWFPLPAQIGGGQ